MKTRLLLALALASLLSCKSSPDSQTADQTTDSGSIIFQAKDKEILEEIFERYSGENEESTSALIVKVGRFFLETPYVAHTLETEEEEQLLIHYKKRYRAYMDKVKYKLIPGIY